MNIFEYGTKKAIRFNYRGTISIEDLWFLTVEELDQIYKNLSAEAKQSQEDSLLNTSSVSKELQVKIDLVKHIVGVKLEQIEKNKLARENRAKKQKLLELIESKKDEAMSEKSIDELTAMLEEIDD